VAVDGSAVITEPRRSHIVYVDPGEHQMEAFFAGNRSISHTISGLEGAYKPVEFVLATVEPAVKPETPVIVQAPAATGASSTPSPSNAEAGGLPRWVTFAGAGVTAALGAATLWSGLDTLHARDDYQRQPTQQGYNDGAGRELRTNILIGATAIAGVATVAVAVFSTRWTGGPAMKDRAAVADRPSYRAGFVTTGLESRVFVQGSF
jgi:hypothetical protein